jgi:type IX secretion system PorP/SprF family membrane protein
MLRAQDIHFSQFNRSFLNLNPALVGDFNGTHRLNANYRNQWSAVSEPFETISFSAETKSPFSQLKDLHLGLLFYNDEAGQGGLQTTQINVSLAYAFKFKEDSSLVANFGIQSGLNSRSINFDVFSFDQQFDGIQFNPNLANGENFDRSSFSHLNVHAGFNLFYKIAERKTLKTGFAFYNLNQANQSFQGSNIPLDQRTNYYIEADYYISEKLDLLPALLYSQQGPFEEMVYGTNIRYRLKQGGFDNQNLYLGIWQRNNDAIIAALGLDYRQWNVGVSYDINTSGLEVASNNRGGLEVAVTYIIQTFKPVIRRYKSCPVYL